MEQVPPGTPSSPILCLGHSPGQPINHCHLKPCHFRGGDRPSRATSGSRYRPAPARSLSMPQVPCGASQSPQPSASGGGLPSLLQAQVLLGLPDPTCRHCLQDWGLGWLPLAQIYSALYHHTETSTFSKGPATPAPTCHHSGHLSAFLGRCQQTAASTPAYSGLEWHQAHGRRGTPWLQSQWLPGPQ